MARKCVRSGAVAVDQTSFAFPQRSALTRASACPICTPSRPVISAITVSRTGAASVTLSPTAVRSVLRLSPIPSTLTRRSIRSDSDFAAPATNPLLDTVLTCPSSMSLREKATCFSLRSDKTSSASASTLASGSLTTRADRGSSGRCIF